MLAVPRHEFIPSYYLKDRDARPLRWIRHEPRDADSTQRWLELVYSPTTLITDLADKIDRGIQAPVSSSTSPRLMIRMLEALDVSEEMRVLENRHLRAVRRTGGVDRLLAPDGSWCEVNRQPDVEGYHAVREAGPTPPWADVETA
ncbi:MAG: hypothetical protein ACRDTF_23240 [Pseudonocardiaceae bacterium]